MLKSVLHFWISGHEARRNHVICRVFHTILLWFVMIICLS